ncbi:hypothetical protein TWF696_001687 [Orbilia brochopaga]|uniref:SAP domain-containing protein n=1 Tax=Orbilia brochopaga TaxID=3140254 RepID=A0AAV9U5T9_9PEZI
MDPASLKVIELKAELKKRGLAVGGLKKELVERLTEALEKENAGQEEPEEEAVEEESPEEEEKDEEEEPAAAVAAVAADAPVDDAEESSVTVDSATPKDKMEDVRADDNKEADTSSSTLAADQPAAAAEDVEMTAEEEKPASEPVVEAAAPAEPPTEEAEKPSEPDPAPQAATVETAEPTPTPSKETPKEPEAVLEPVTTAPTPLQAPEAVQSIEADISKRRKRSRSPSARAEEVEAKKARVQEVLPGRDDESMADAAPVISTDSPERERGRASPPRDRSRSRSRDRSRSRSRGGYDRRSRSRSRTQSPSHHRQRPSITASTKDARFKSLFSKQDSATTAAPHTTAIVTGAASPSRSDDDDIVSPSIHPATRALYIRELVRPLQESQLKSHLIQLASSRASESGPADDSVLEMIYLDGIKTHCFAIFATVQACSRARNGVHGKLFPNEKNRKVLFADYVPEEKVDAWIAREKQNRGVRYVVTYGDSDDGVEAIHEEYSGMGNATYGSNYTAGGPRGSIGSAGVPERGRAPADAPAGPRGRGGSGMAGTGANAAPAGARVVSLDELFLCTKTKPKIYYKPVDEATVKERIAKGPVEGEVRGRPGRKGSSDTWRGGFGRGGRGGGGGIRRVGGDSWTSRDRDREFERRDWVRDGGRGDRRGPYRERSPVGRW